MIWIILIITGLVVAAGALLAPLYAMVEKRSPTVPAEYAVRVALVHPWLAELVVRSPEGRLRIRLLHRFSFPSRGKPDEESEEGDVMPTTAPVAPRRPAEPAAWEGEESRSGRSADYPGSFDQGDGEARRSIPGSHGHWASSDEEESRPLDEPLPQDGEAVGSDGGAWEQQESTSASSPGPGRVAALKSWWRRVEENRVVFVLRRRAWRAKVFRWVVRVLRSFLSLVAFDRCRLSVAVGTGSHDVTGMLAGAFWAGIGALKSLNLKRIEIAFEPVFGLEPTLRWHGSLRLHTSVLRVVWPLVVALCTFPYVSTLIVWIRLRQWTRRKRRTAEAVSEGLG